MYSLSYRESNFKCSIIKKQKTVPSSFEEISLLLLLFPYYPTHEFVFLYVCLCHIKTFFFKPLLL